MEQIIGGQRLGSGNKMKVALHNYERSTHDLGRIIRTTMAPGTLVPCLNEIALPGDKFEIELDTLIRTAPTASPLLGSFKFQVDIFTIPMRLYQAQLHMNLLGVGMNMANIKLPMQLISCNNPYLDTKRRGKFNQSSLIAYTGLRGASRNSNNSIGLQSMYRNALFTLGYYDIVKQYYSNKQEENAFVIAPNMNGLYKVYGISINGGNNFDIVEQDGSLNSAIKLIPGNNSVYFDGVFKTDIILKLNCIDSLGHRFKISRSGNDILSNDGNFIEVKLDGGYSNAAGEYSIYITSVVQNDDLSDLKTLKLQSFPLKNIDDMREKILQKSKGTAFVISNDSPLPYRAAIGHENFDGEYIPNVNASQAGLCVKTYQSDIFNNWLQTEWITGNANAISEITAVDTSDGKLIIDDLNLAQKVYNMLNRVAVSDGSYQGWQSAVYGEETIRMAENPIYVGGMSREIVFEEVVSTAETETKEAGSMPLGTMAGKGSQTREKKGGNISIEIKEPSIIMGIMSITPRLDYSQGNKWYTNLETMDDLHKPALDGIGFQDLITEQMAYWDGVYNSTTKLTTFKSAGKQPSWLNYMTAYNEVYGLFAEEQELQQMVLTRNYEGNFKNDNWGIKDLTTYIDPTKFNYAFAQTSLDAQNFWVQLGIDMIARRKMSAKIIPNL